MYVGGPTFVALLPLLAWEKNRKSGWYRNAALMRTLEGEQRKAAEATVVVRLRVLLLLITQIPYTVRVPGKGRNGCILQPKPSNRTLSQLYEYQVGYSIAVRRAQSKGAHG